MPSEIITGFSYISDSDAEILILGSIPSITSLTKNEYYGHPRNSFWWIMANIFNFSASAEYKTKIKLLRQNHIALWDVLKCCKRPGSLDSAIVASSIEPNNFSGFFIKHPQIRKVLFNGSKAETEFNKRIRPEIEENYPSLIFERMPSTSPAMATLNKFEKLEIWRNALKI